MNFLVSDKTEQYIDRELWKIFVLSFPGGNFFQHPDYLEYFSSSSKHDPITVCATNSSGKITGIISGLIYREYNGIFGRLTSRFIIIGGPLIENAEDNIAGPLLKKLEEVLYDRVIYTQIRNLFSLSKLENTFYNQNYQFEEHLNYIVDISKGVDYLWDNINSKRRNEIRKALKSGTIVRPLRHISELKESYQILSEVYSRARLPLLDYGIFLSAFSKSKGSEGFLPFGAFNSGKLIGTLYTLCFNGTIYNWYAGSLSRHYDKHPNDLIPWEVFLWGKENRFNKFDFGGAGKPDIPYGVREYKKKFGGELVSYGRFEKINKPGLMKIATKGFYILRLLKMKF